MNLDNIMYIIIFLLLIVILGFLYYMSNNIKKNQNKINILESELNALRERMGVHHEKMNSIDNYLNKDMLEKKSSNSPNKDNSADFANFLERIASMNGGINDFKDDEDYSDDGSSVDEEDVYETEEDDVSTSSSSSKSSTSSSNSKSSSKSSVDNNSSSEEELNDNESVLPSNSEPEHADEPVVSDVREPEPEPEPEPVKSVGLDDLLDIDADVEEKISATKPAVPIKKLDLGTVMPGKDGKSKYIVSLNKSGKKYWKKT